MVFAVSCSKEQKQETKQSSEAPKVVTPDKETVKPVVKPGAVGTKAADFALTDLDGNPVSLSDYNGKVVLLNFWATWCPPCKKEIPDFIRIYNSYKSNGLEIVGVTGFRDKISQVTNYVETAKINYPVLFAEDKVKPSLIANYGNFNSIPTSFLIDKEGMIRHVWTGAIDEEGFMKVARKYLN